MPPKPQDAHAVVSWRRTELLRCGFPRSLAVRIARDERYDLHYLIELVEQGCSPTLAVRVLSPMETTGAGREQALP
jgi:hypothetical protein